MTIAIEWDIMQEIKQPITAVSGSCHFVNIVKSTRKTHRLQHSVKILQLQTVEVHYF